MPALQNTKWSPSDYGLKRNILRCLATVGCEVTVVPVTASADDILAMEPDGVFPVERPRRSAATGEYAVPEIRKLVHSGKPLFGICLGHQMLALALGAQTRKMHQGHHGAIIRSRISPPQGRDHLDEPRLHRRSLEPARRRGRDPRVALRRLELRTGAWESRCSRCNTTTEASPGPRTATISSPGSSKRWRRRSRARRRRRRPKQIGIG